MRTGQRACTVAMVTAAALIGLTGCGTPSEPGSGTSSSTTTSAVTADDLQLRVKSMRVAIYKGRYRDAYDMRSDACRKVIGYDEYARAIATEFADKPHPGPDSLRVLVITAEDPSRGVHRAQAQLYEAGHEQDPANETPRWWTVEEGQWKFDNCTPPAR
ncbi:hypothetical protein NONI108955_33760 [Nocardia ninae]|uniref:Lipoprotein n=1 Tax=Nocardia ninae NBRC 108245 TaxID=1210091 RepID=A0A511M5L1_9NOCA|nr:hypothetical protein [Nocardia ninae]GEM35922.1 hypothetical protein NN4_04410 [Nocardia ninae NBRC 108245]